MFEGFADAEGRVGFCPPAPYDPSPGEEGGLLLPALFSSALALFLGASLSPSGPTGAVEARRVRRAT